MKMRKILSFVLVLSLVLGSFSMAFAATPSTGLSDIAGIANEDAVQVNADLGIITGFPDGTFLPEKSVTRAEFAAMITRALAVPESALAGYTSTTFKDTAGYGWAVPYLAFAQSKGIMIGDGMGNAMPGRTINVNEAMTMVLRAIGYVNHSSVLVGTWPSNYVTVAQNVGLYDDVAAAVTVDRANAAQIIYNALTVQKVAVNSDGATTYLTTASKDEANLLNTGLNCTSTTTAALDPAGLDSTINLNKYTGVPGTYYSKSGDVVAFTVDADNVTLVGDLNTARTKLTVGSTTYELKTVTNATSAPAFVNGVAKGNTSLATVTGTAMVTVNGEISGKYITKISSIAYWDITDPIKVTAADIADISDEKFAGIAFEKDNDGNIDLKSFVLVGVNSLSDIAKDDIAYIYTDNDNNTGKIKKIAIGTEVVTGKVTAYDGTEFTVNGKDYETAKDAGLAGAKNVSFDITHTGKDVELTLDAYGYVYDYKVTSASTDKYGVIVKYDNVSLTEQVKVYTAAADDNEIFAVTTDGKTALTTTAPGTLIGYGLNKDGKIDNAVVGKVATNATLAGVRNLIVTNAGVSTAYAVSTDVVVFTSNGAVYDVSAIDKVNTYEALGSVAYVLDGTKVVALMVSTGVADKAADDVYFVVNSTKGIWDEDEEKTLTEVTGLSAGTTFVKSVIDSSTVTKPGTTVPDLFIGTISTDGYLKNATTTAFTLTGSATDVANVASVGSLLEIDNVITEISKDVIVYELVKKDGTSFDTYTTSSLDRIRVGYSVYLFNTISTTDSDYEGYDIVVFVRN